MSRPVHTPTRPPTQTLSRPTKLLPAHLTASPGTPWKPHLHSRCRFHVGACAAMSCWRPAVRQRALQRTHMAQPMCTVAGCIIPHASFGSVLIAGRSTGTVTLANLACIPTVTTPRLPPKQLTSSLTCSCATLSSAGTAQVSQIHRSLRHIRR